MGVGGLLGGYISKNFNSIVLDEKRWIRFVCYIALMIFGFYTGVTILTNGKTLNDFGYIALLVSCILLAIQGSSTENSRRKTLKTSMFVALICYLYGFLQMMVGSLLISGDKQASVMILCVGVLFNIVSIYGTIKDTRK